MNFAYKLLRRGASSNTLDFVSVKKLCDVLSKKRVVFFGEFHSEVKITAVCNEIVKALSSSSANRQREGRGDRVEEGISAASPQTCPAAKSSSSSGQTGGGGGGRGRLHVILEHFSLSMQDLLKRYQSDPNFHFDDLVREYEQIGTEGHSLDAYRPMLEFAKASSPDRVQLHGGFIPRPFASRLTKVQSSDEHQKLFAEIFEKDFLPPPPPRVPKTASPQIPGSAPASEQNSPSADSNRQQHDFDSTFFREPYEGQNLFEFKSTAAHWALFEHMMSGREVYSEEAARKCCAFLRVN